MLELLDELNADDGVDGILVQLPLPEHMDEPTVTRSVDAAKDVDGFHPLNAGRLFLGEPLHVPATPLGVMAMLAEYEVELKGKEAVVIGRSEIVGQADRDAAPRAERDRDDLSLANRRSRRARAPRRRSRRRRRKTRAS